VVAGSGQDARTLAEEQVALRRVATLAARGSTPSEVFRAITEEVGRLLAVEFAIMGRFDADRTVVSVGGWGAPAGRFPVGSRAPLEGENLVTIVFETGRPARVDDYAQSTGSIGAVGREAGFHSAVGAPIVVDGRLWGLMTVGSAVGKPPLPAGAEARLASFTELLAMTIANTESRAGLTRLADEQAALRRVATLVARGIPHERLFAAVIEEVGRLLGVEYAFMGRFETGGVFVTVANWGSAGVRAPLGVRQMLGGRNLVTLVFETARSARMDDYGAATGPLGDVARETGVRSGVATPILVEGSLWGVIVAGSTLEQPLAQHTEAQLASFTALVATAIANGESQAGLDRLASEQAALRRVATLVAEAMPHEELFAAVAEEIGRLLPVDFVHMGRYEPGDSLIVLATWGTTTATFPVGRRWNLGGRNLATIVYQTGRPGRIDGYSEGSGPLGVTGRELGLRSSVGTPILVEGRVWGVVIAGSTSVQTPPDTETRLASFTELMATAIANAESRAALAASRARIVAAADESRRRIERDLHDGAQQRLVHAVIALKLALQALSDGNPNAGELATEALQHAEQANSELRELAHGILPAALTRGGLRAGVNGLVSRLSMPVTVDVSVERLPAGVEATAFFVVSEALMNVVKHARAGSAEVSARLDRGRLRVEVCDDGVGGARGGAGTGLGGIEDRVAALDGSLVVESPRGGGTRVCALLPLADES
jgi:signal transduction histidine kinase